MESAATSPKGSFAETGACQRTLGLPFPNPARRATLREDTIHITESSKLFTRLTPISTESRIKSGTSPESSFEPALNTVQEEKGLANTKFLDCARNDRGVTIESNGPHSE